ncbi:hypothetical protein Tco_1340546, partial [Tanacetum coccineum]
TLFTEYVQHFEDTLDQITGNLESADVCWVRYRFLASTSPNHKFTPVAANDVSLEIETKEDNHSHNSILAILRMGIPRMLIAWLRAMDVRSDDSESELY